MNRPEPYQFVLARDVIGAEAPVAISQADFDALKAARPRLLQALFLEEKFDILIENHLDFDGEALLSSARHMIRRGEDFIWFSGERALFNRHIVNVMSSARGYIDHAKSSASDWSV